MPIVKDCYLLPENGNFYKSNLHTHTTFSDGAWTLEETKKNYMDKGYSIIAFTDHNCYAWRKELDDENFLALAAVEVDMCDGRSPSQGWDCVKVYHLNLFDTQPESRGTDYKGPPRLGDNTLYSTDYINEYVKARNEEGFLVCYNHPYWSLQDYRDYCDLKGLFAMEIYNHGCELDGLYGYNPQVYDEMLRAGQKLFCLSTDDNHDRFPIDDPMNDSFGGFTMIKAPKLDYASVIEAMKAGHFYASTGPEIKELYIKDDTLYVTCSPVEKIYTITEGRRCYAKVAPKGQTITSAEFKLDGKEGYVRIDCRDEKGFHATSNPYFI